MGWLTSKYQSIQTRENAIEQPIFCYLNRLLKKHYLHKGNKDFVKIAKHIAFSSKFIISYSKVQGFFIQKKNLQYVSGFAVVNEVNIVNCSVC